MRVDRGMLGWGIFLVIAGAIPLAVAQGWLPSDIRWWELWPLILVGIGLAILLRRTSFAPIGGLLIAATFGAIVGGALAGGGFPVFSGGCLGGSNGTAFAPQTGTLTGGASSVRLDMACGDVTVASAAGSDWRIEGTSDGGRPPAIDRSGSSLTARVASNENVFGARSTWDVTLPTGPKVDLSVSQNAGSARLGLTGMDLGQLEATVNAGDGRIDLTGTTPARLTATVNAGSAKIQLPAASMSGDLTVNAGSISLCAAPGTALRLQTNDNITGGYDYGGHGLVQSGNTWTTPGWDTATVRIDLTTSANAGSFTLDPQEGCQ